ncbi:hypothetical protein BKG71_00015, partial [Mycobacteroides chelonae]|uniref:hypothetical protein n=2 Tax=Mycobacteriaceae TaxID=1762 RepID=UPI0008A907C7
MTVTATQVIEQIRIAADLEPDRTAFCLYWNSTKGCAECIVGVALANLGFAEELRNANGELGTADLAMSTLGITGKKIQFAWIALVQALQDGRVGVDK